MLNHEQIKENLRIVRENVAKAERLAGAKEDSTTLIAVTKTHSKEALTLMHTLGVKDIGENYIQEAATKFEELNWVESSPVRRHFIGHLQSNKAKQAVKYFDVLQSVDSVKLLETIGKHAESEGKKIEVMLQVNISNEPQKSGLSPNEVESVIKSKNELKNVNLTGIMTIGSIDGQKNEFFLMKELFYRLQNLENNGIIIKYISMGMSHDYIDAIKFGATHIRVGTSIFGARGKC